MRRDVIYAWRSLLRAKGLVLACIVSLGLGLSATTVLFSVVDAALLKAPPFPRADRIAIIASTQTTARDGESVGRWSWPRFLLLRASIRSTDRIAAFTRAVLSVTTGDVAEALPLEVASSDYMRVAGVRPIVGREFTPADELAGSLPVAILAHDLWTTRFASDSSIVGRTVTVNAVKLTVVGIMPAGFAGLGGQARLWISPAAAQLVSYAEWLTTNQNFISVAGRLRDGVFFDDARRELRELGARIHAEQPGAFDHADTRFGATAVSLADARSDPATARALALLSGAVVLLLLLACANVASLLLGRGDARRREMAIRLAIGANRGVLIRQLLVESAILAMAACAVASLVAWWATRLIALPPTLSRGRSFYGAVGEFATPTFDLRVFAFAAMACVVTVAMFGLLPAWRATRAEVTSDLKAGSQSVGTGGRRLELRDWVVALQVCLAMMLLLGGGTLLASYGRLRVAEVGFDRRNLLTFMLRPSEVQYAAEKAPLLLDQVLAAINRVPGVASTTLDGCAPLAVQCAGARLQVVGHEVANVDAPEVRRHYVAPEHFTTLGIPLLRGRALTADDRAGRPHVVVINAEAARRFWPNEDPIGKRVWFNANATFGSADSAAEIVGIVGNVAYRPLDSRPMEPDFFTSYRQFTFPSRLVMIRANRDPLSLVKDVAAAVRGVDPNLALFDVMTMEQRAGASWAKRTFETWLLVAFAVIAIVLATVGVYAVTSYSVARRTREFGVRIALGATDASILETAASRTMRLALVGLVVGLLAALAGSRVLRSFLYETSPMEPVVVGAVGGVALVVLALATYVPARRALRTQPVEILRSE